MRKRASYTARVERVLADKYRFRLVERKGAIVTTWIVSKGDVKIAKFYVKEHAEQFVQIANDLMSVEV